MQTLQYHAEVRPGETWVSKDKQNNYPSVPILKNFLIPAIFERKKPQVGKWFYLSLNQLATLYCLACRNFNTTKSIQKKKKIKEKGLTHFVMLDIHNEWV